MTTVLVAQLNYDIGDVASNKERILSVLSAAENSKSKLGLILFGRYAVPGHLEKDHVFSRDFSKLCSESISDLAEKVSGTHVIVGSVILENGSFFEVIYLITPEGQLRELLRLPAFLAEGFEEIAVFSINGLQVALLLYNTQTTCVSSLPTYRRVPDDIDLVIILGKSQHSCVEQLDLLGSPMLKQAKQLVYLNMVGGYVSNVFSGGSIAFTAETATPMALWKEDLLLLDLAKSKPAGNMPVPGVPCSATSVCSNDDYKITNNTVKNYLDIKGLTVAEPGYLPPMAENNSCSQQEFTYQGLMVAVRDFINKNSFAGAVLGLSGGIDSALMAVIAADALGAENVHTFMLPTRYTSQSSIEDARECAARLGIRHTIISIEETFCSCSNSLHSLLNTKSAGSVAEENIQSRIRGMFLMAISNSTNLLLLATGNKSEALTGYMTLYGDTCGGFAPLKNIYKTGVYDLVNWRNRNIPNLGKCKKLDIVPASIVDKPPSAELKFNQKDQDTLPEYDKLDQILELLIDKQLCKEHVIRHGFTKEEVDLVEHLVKRSYFKLSQVAPGPIIY